jgi:hypothetical protein
MVPMVPDPLRMGNGGWTVLVTVTGSQEAVAVAVTVTET